MDDNVYRINRFSLEEEKQLKGLIAHRSVCLMEMLLLAALALGAAAVEISHITKNTLRFIALWASH